MKKFTKGLVAVLISASMLAGCDILGIGKDKKEEQQQQTDTNVAVTGVSLGLTSLQVFVGDNATLNAIVAPQNATNKAVTWSSDHPEIASVADGKVTGVSVGTAVITVTTTDGNKTAQCTVTVSEKTPDVILVESITLNKESIELDVGGSDDLSATVLPGNATNKTYTWSSSDESVATVVDGHVVAVAAGTAIISVTTQQGGKHDECTVKVNSTEHPQTIKSGAYVELEGTGYTFANGKDGEIIHLEEVNNKTKVWGITGGTVTLAKGGHTYPVTVLFDVAQITLGTTYSAYATRTAEYTLVSNPDKFTVGNKNKFYPHFELLCNSYLDDGSGWGEDEITVDLLNVKTYFDAEDKPQLIVSSDYAEINSDYSLSFKEAAIGQDVLVSLSYKSNTINMTVSVKEGYNAHSHEELKAFVEDTTIGGQINILRNINAELSRDRFFEDPSQPAAPDGTHMYPTNIYESAHTKTNTGSVYNRVFVSGEEANPITINGNFLEIDARNVPDHVPSLVPGQRTPTGPVPNNGEGIFYIQTPSATQSTDLALNNVKITGNSRVGTTELPVAGAYGLAAVVSNGTGIEFNNAKIDHVERGTFAIWGSRIDATNTSITDVWGGGLQGYAAKSLSMTHCYADHLGGPVFYQMGNREVGERKTDVTWDKTTTLNNWMSANSSWCQINGLTDLGQGLAMIEDNVNQMNFTIYGADNTFNFIYLGMTNQVDENVPVTVYNNVTIKNPDATDYVITESPSDIDSLPAQHPVAQIKQAAGAYMCGAGQSWTDMASTIANVISAPGIDGDPMKAYGYALGNYLGTQAATIGHAYLNISYHIGELFGTDYGYCTAIAETLPKLS